MGLFPDYLGHGDNLQRWILYWVSKLNGNLTSTTLATADSSVVVSISFSRILSSFVGLILAWFLGSCIWYRYMSPISDIPGPFLASFSRLWLIQLLRRGRGARGLVEMHEKYGEQLSASERGYYCWAS